MPPTGSGEWAGTQTLGTAGNGPCTMGMLVTCVPERTPEAAEGPRGRAGGAGGHKVRLFLKWTAGEARGAGPTPRYMAVCPMGFGTSSSCHHPGLRQPVALPGMGDGAKQSAEGALGEAAGAGGVLPHLLVTPTGRDAFPRLCWLDGARPLHPCCPGPTVQVAVPVYVGRGRADSPATAHSPQSLKCSEAETPSPEAHE